MPGHVEVILPFRRDDAGYRARALERVCGLYAEHHPYWAVTTSQTPPAAPWVKAIAVTAAARASTAEILVIADADVWTTGLTGAVEAVAAGATWAIPHLQVFRLTRAASWQTPSPAAPAITPPDADLEERPYRGVEGGGIVVLPRRLALDVPLDPRFCGWGGEDLAWGYALRCLAGPPWRGTAPLIHL